jgi:subtilisin family serine protease
MKEIGRKIKVVVIDSGINTQISDLKDYVVHSTGFGINNNGYITEISNIPVRHPHGTVVAMIIRHMCSDVEFISVNILDENLLTDGRILAYALSQVFDYNPDIIHMSLGTLKKRYIFPLKKIVKEARRLNIHLVAAAENSEKVSYPAHLKGVFGVKSYMFNDYKFYTYKDGFFYAPLGTCDIECIQKISNIKTAKGTSMSAAYISGHLAEILKNKNNLSYKEAKEILLQRLKKER